MPRAILLILDSVGIGGAPDAEAYGDAGADTVGHIAKACARGEADKHGVREGPLAVANLVRLGLGRACELATGRVPPGLEGTGTSDATYGCAAEVSNGKDTPSGHWEIAGLPVRFDWGYFPRTVPCFPEHLTEALCRRADLPGILGNCHGSGTELIARFGEEHMRTGAPICYTSADSVFQIAAHEEAFGLERLYAVCRVARELVDDLRIGRVIARPFLGDSPASFKRTANRRDFSVPPHAPTLLDITTSDVRHVITVGKIGDIFAHSGTGEILKGDGNRRLFDRTLEGMDRLRDGGLLMTNFVDFDTVFGHRRDVVGYAAALETFDAQLPRLMDRLREDDIMILTADHGCDPTWTGTDHTRELVPILAVLRGRTPACIGRRETFADIAATVAQHLGIPPPAAGTPF